MNDDAELLSRKIANTDGLIIGSPTYVSNISSLLKQFVDRGHFVIEQLLHKKYAVSVVTGENYGNIDTSKILTKLIKYSGAKLSGKIIYTLPFNSSSLTDKKLKKKIYLIAEKLKNDISKRRIYPIQSFIHNMIFNIGIKPFVLRKGKSYDGVILKWKQQQIIK